MKRLSVNIGFTRYLVSEKDAIKLLGIAARSPAIEHKGGSYKDPFVLAADAKPFVTGAELVEVEQEPDAAQPSVYTAAARGLP